MRVLCVYIVAVVIIQQMFTSVVDANPEFMLSKCCKAEETPATAQRREKVKQMMEECQKELGEPVEGEHKGRFACMAECMSTKLNILNEDKTLNDEEFKKYIVNEMATQDYQKAVAETVATKCAEAAKQPDAEPETDAAPKCSKSAFKAMKCVMKEMVEACPADLQNQDEHCVKMREMVSKGEFKPPA